MKPAPLQQHEKEALLAVLPVLIEIQDLTMSNKQLIPTLIAWQQIKDLVNSRRNSMSRYLNLNKVSSFEDKEKLLISIDPISWNKKENIFTFLNGCLLFISLIITCLSFLFTLIDHTNWATIIFVIIFATWFIFIRYQHVKIVKKLNAIRVLNAKLYLDIENTLEKDNLNYPYGSLKQF